MPAATPSVLSLQQWSTAFDLWLNQIANKQVDQATAYSMLFNSIGNQLDTTFLNIYTQMKAQLQAAQTNIAAQIANLPPGA